MRSNQIIFNTILVLILLLSSCKDAQLEEEVLDYCTCLDKYKQDEVNRFICIEMMEELQEKYKNKPRKLNALVEQTNQCW